MFFFRKWQIESAIKNAVEKAIRSGQDSALKVLDLNKEISELKVELEDIKLKKKIELQEIEHLVKLEREKNTIDLEKKELVMKDSFKDKEMELLRKNHTDSMKILQDGHSQMKEMYQEIMKRLPNVNMSIRQHEIRENT